MQNYIFGALFEAGIDFDIKPFGIRAMTLMALEKSYKLTPRELSVQYSAFESGLDGKLLVARSTAENFVNNDHGLGSAAIENANSKLVMENNRECYHRDAGHPELISVLGTYSIGKGLPDYDPDHMTALWRAANIQDGRF